jgi:N-acetylmuramoyl-L-alanine amidase
MGTGQQLLRLSQKHVGEKYVFGATAPKENGSYRGPWDCAEFASWLVFQVSQKLYGCADNSAQPSRADAFTGFWGRDVASLGRKVSIEQAAGIPGAFVLRRPGSAGIKIGHVVVSDGAGGTIEAHSTKLGVIASSLKGRAWDFGVLIPWMEYPDANPTTVEPASDQVLRLKDPFMKGTQVRSVQRLLKNAGFNPGPVDGIYGHQTAAAVQAFQISKGLLPDAECGPTTLKALERMVS